MHFKIFLEILLLGLNSVKMFCVSCIVGQKRLVARTPFCTERSQIIDKGILTYKKILNYREAYNDMAYLGRSGVANLGHFMKLQTGSQA